MTNINITNMTNYCREICYNHTHNNKSQKKTWNYLFRAMQKKLYNCNHWHHVNWDPSQFIVLEFQNVLILVSKQNVDNWQVQVLVLFFQLSEDSRQIVTSAEGRLFASLLRVHQCFKQWEVLLLVHPWNGANKICGWERKSVSIHTVLWSIFWWWSTRRE